MVLSVIFFGGGVGPNTTVSESTSDVLVLVTGSSNERQPALPDDARALLRENALAEGGNSSVTVVGVDGDGSTRAQGIDLVPRRGGKPDGDEERTPKRREVAADRNVDRVDAAVAGIVATRPGHALLAGFQEAGRQKADTIVVVSSGLDTNNPFDLRKTGFDYSPADLVTYLKKENALPTLSGKTVLLALSAADGTQQKLDEPSRRNVERLWTAVLKASGATVRTVASRSEQTSVATVATPPIPVPVIESPHPPEAGSGVTPSTTFILPANLLFKPNLPTLADPAEARAQLQTVVDHVDAGTTISIEGHTAYVQGAPSDGVPFSRKRALAIRSLLLELGVRPAAITQVTGVGHLHPIVQPADDPRNRAVLVVLTHRS